MVEKLIQHMVQKEETMSSSVFLTKVINKLELNNLTPDIPISKTKITLPDINRPALQLTGYFDHFDSERVQIIGYVEYTYLESLDVEKKIAVYHQLLASKIPCIIYTTLTLPDQHMLKLAKEYAVPLLTTNKTTSSFMAEIIRWLNVELAPCISIHGV